MPRRICRLTLTGFWSIAISCALLFTAITALAQEVSVVRLPIDNDMTVRLVNLSTHVSYDRTGNSYFIVSPGRYSVQLLRNGQIAYEEVEYVDANSPSTRTVNPKREEIVVGLPEEPPQFGSTICAALETASQLTINRYGLHGGEVQRRMQRGEIAREAASCSTSDEIDGVSGAIAGSYGVTPLGMIGLSIEYSPLAGVPRPHNRGNSPIYNDPATQRLATTQQPNSNLTPSLVGDLKNGIADVAIDSNGKPFLVCAAINAFTPLFCDGNGLAAATPAIGHLRGLYRFTVKTTPVDHLGVELDHWSSFAPDDEYHATLDKLAADTEKIRQSLEQQIAQLNASAVTVPSRIPDQMSRYYPTPDLVALIATTQKAVDTALKNPALQPLRAHFPATLAQVGDTSRAATHDLDAQAVFSALRNVVVLLQSASGNLGIDLVFRTSPVQTEGSRLDFDKCERCIPIISQGGQHRFYRGKYYIHVTRDGYLPYEGWLDLIDDPRTILECDLVRTRRTDPSRASSCSLRSQ